MLLLEAFFGDLELDSDPGRVKGGTLKAQLSHQVAL